MEIYNLVTKCVGCRHAQGTVDYDKNELDGVCAIYLRPRAKWNKLGGCEGATHIKRELKEDVRVRVGQQKQKKEGK